MDPCELIAALEEVGIHSCSVVAFGGDTPGDVVIDSRKPENRLWVLQPGENGAGYSTCLLSVRLLHLTLIALQTVHHNRYDPFNIYWKSTCGFCRT